jgi:hypothetical protein
MNDNAISRENLCLSSAAICCECSQAVRPYPHRAHPENFSWTSPRDRGAAKNSKRPPVLKQWSGIPSRCKNICRHARNLHLASMRGEESMASIWTPTRFISDPP